ncbi:MULTISPECIES: TetR/AcrR family transcriptional regulator [Lysinibacillus]|uniref:TetR/AcrR family transcriptional regulator n=1 Tax=Lysinibacillus antri TaxID=2498145 RepID=A0A3S0RK28_9BACI|nr:MULTISPECIES: TetR/AcrR family transcriptional regulator [Lysinibacillus]RUL54160.1 TetR/AcrR family transcriptional regulator [Lysinibacillus antri]TSI07352.1 TetR/AcrR family transcriptional regulator [Lysinibacillus sp. BW-2-10]
MVRGRKVNSNGEKSKQLLRTKAIEIFSTKGYYQTKISDIVKAANVTQPTFYLYFESKESLFLDLKEEFQQNLNNIFEHPQEFRISQVIEKLLYYFAENPLLTKIGLYQSDDSFLVKEKLVEKFQQVLEKEKNQYHLLEGLDIKTISQSLMGSIERLTLTLLITEQKTAAELSEELLSIYFNQQAALATAK